MTTYHVAQAMMGHAIVMTDDEGNSTTIQAGIKRYDSAVKIRDRWIKREAEARAKAAKLNQCDGCRRGLPLADGVHKGDGYDLIACTAHLYADTP